MLIIGDVHCKVHQWRKLIEKSDSSICVGDFGFQPEWDWLHKTDICTNHLINMGNHDYIPYRETSIYSTDNFGVISNNIDSDIFTIAGASSIDKAMLIEGLDWFANEELSYFQGDTCIELYQNTKPEIVISHDCPQIICESFFGYTDKSFTRNLLQALFEIHQPKLWIFGHHHKSRNKVIDGTRFICLAELETYQI